MIGKVLLLLAVLLILFVVYEIIGLFKKKARTAYVCEDGRFLTFGDAVFSVSDDSYIFHDYTQLPANRFQGHSNVENGLALINLRNDPSSSDLTYALHKEGWVDLSGNIYGESGLRVGYITDRKGRPGINGSGRWFEIWLRKHSYVWACSPLAGDGGGGDRLIGKVVETGRFCKAKPHRYTVTARAGGFLLLYKDRQPKPASEDSLTERLTWKDTALPSAVIFTFIYSLFFFTGMGRTTFPALGDQIGFTVAMLAVYFAIWLILRQVKIEASLDGKAFDDFLMLIGRNTGVNGLNNWIILSAAASLLVSIYIYGSDFVPLQAAILIGVWMNRRYVTKEPWILSDADDEEEIRLPDNDPDDVTIPEGGVERSYFWNLDSLYHTLHGELKLTFDPEIIAALRTENPFRKNPERSHKANAAELFDTCRNNGRVREVLRYIDKMARQEGLGELDRMQFILDFVQCPNIAYELDEKCDEIGFLPEYARYPDETMYDRRGDCDCKAVLAAVLFREAGYKTAYLMTCDHAAVAVAFKNKNMSSLVSLADQSLVTKDGYMYFFCETTGDGFRIGDLGNTTKEAVEDIIFLN